MANKGFEKLAKLFGKNNAKQEDSLMDEQERLYWEEMDRLSGRKEMEANREAIQKIEQNGVKIGFISQSSERIASGTIASHSYDTAYYQYDGKYVGINSEYDDFADTEEPYYYEIGYDKIVKKIAEAENHTNTYQDVYSGSVADIADDTVSCSILDEQLSRDVECYNNEIQAMSYMLASYISDNMELEEAAEKYDDNKYALYDKKAGDYRRDESGELIYLYNAEELYRLSNINETASEAQNWLENDFIEEYEHSDTKMPTTASEWVSFADHKENGDFARCHAAELELMRLAREPNIASIDKIYEIQNELKEQKKELKKQQGVEM